MPSCDSEITDIEDFVIHEDVTPVSRTNARKDVLPKSRKLAKKDRVKEEKEVPVGDSIIPGTQTIYVRTWGCSHNNSDSEYMAGQLAAYGYKITDDEQCADLWLLNSCTVKSPAEDGFRNAIKKAKAQGKHLVVAGCVPQGQPRHDTVKGISVVGVQQIDRVVEVVEETLKGHTVRLFGQKKADGKKTGGASLDLPKIRKNPLVEIIAINTGCLNQCTYCKTKHARGDLGSYPPEEIVNRAKQAFNEGVVEMWLTSEDTGAYGKDIGVTLPELLWQLVKVIPEGGRMRIGMTNPPYILEHLEEMAKILNHPRVYSFLHVPVQSASTNVLADMKREYIAEDFEHVVNYLRQRVPDLTIATDLICGFPTETEDDFQKTLDLVKKYKFPSLFINQFYPRPGTPAARMKRLPTEEVKRRTREVSKLFQSYTTYDHKVGAVQEVLVTEESHDGVHYVGHNKAYDQVLVKKDEGELMGKIVKVEMTSSGKHYLMGRVMQDEPARSPGLTQPLPKGAVSGMTTEKLQMESPRSHNKWVKLAAVVLLLAVLADAVRLALSWAWS
ncbi:predicted protein [Nematostella vectensis]|uniref:tRNA-t(6)A37 methylthiotransferase n=1 Tax=Nematostella vectensis TaxID=45351 RepID=A7S7F5_NEMVE|nr:predicted protein [Nematostella vectensis]|eukprot:XP_001632455.1 predicted protein [Nematostella vectensis]